MQHFYKAQIQWTGNKGRGTLSYADYERSFVVSVEGKPDIEASSDPAFRGDKAKYNPEELLLSSLSSCHMLWFLHLCAEAGIVVMGYTDNAEGTMLESADGSGHFTGVTLKPVVTVNGECTEEEVLQLHRKANRYCFIANSVNFPIEHLPILIRP